MHATRRSPALVLVAALALLLAGCFNGQPGPVHVIANGTAVPLTPASLAGTGVVPTPGAGNATVAPIPFTPTAPQSSLDPNRLTGFLYPIAGACLPSRSVVMPNAPRTWRHGVNEGVDFYNGDVCTTVERGTPVRAMYAGVVIRADLNYHDLTAQEVQVLATRTAGETTTDPQSLDAYGGRQVWIEHGHGIVSRYENLSAIPRGIGVGVDVAAGQTIGAVGESGMPESVTAPGTQIHLHVEVWVGTHYLGEGLPANQVRALYQQLFSGAATPGG